MEGGRSVGNERPIFDAAGFFYEFLANGTADRLVFEEINHGGGQNFGGLHHPFVADGHSAAGDNRPGVPRGLKRRARDFEVEQWNKIAHVAKIRGAAVELLAFNRVNVGLEPGFLHVGGPLDRSGELLFLLRKGRRSHPDEIGMQKAEAILVEESFVDSFLHGKFGFDARHQGRTLRHVADATEDFLHAGIAGIAEPTPELRTIGHDIRGIAGSRNGVMHANRGFNVLAHQVDAMREKFEAVQGAAAIPRIDSSVGRTALEIDPDIHQRRARDGGGARAIGGVPGQTHVQIVEQSSTCHIRFPAKPLLGRGAIIADCAGEFLRRDQLFDGGRRGQTPDAKEVMATSVSGGAGFARFLDCGGILREARQSIVLADNSDQRPTAAIARYEGSRHISHTALHRKSEAFGTIRKGLGRVCLKQRRFRPAPDLVAEINKFRPVAFNRGKCGALLVFTCQGIEAQDRQNQQDRD